MSSTDTGEPLARTVAALRRAGCVFAEDEARLLIDAAGTAEELDALLRRRVAGEPLEVILGWVDFCGLRLAVEAGVFVPRQRSAFLVELAVELAVELGRPGAVVLDLCCGTGAIGAAIAARLARAELRAVELHAVELHAVELHAVELHAVELHCADLDPVAVRCAARNVAAAGGRVYHGDLYQPLPNSLRGRVDILAVNAPYVPTADIAFMPPEARECEPRGALDGGPDGVGVHRRVAAGAADWLAAGGNLLIETGERQAELTARAMSEHGLRPRVATSDELHCTVVIGTKSGG